MIVMKKIFTLLLLVVSAFSFKTQAQGTACNAEFAVQYLSPNTVKFNPVITVGSPTVSHLWSFGDGSPLDNTVSPTHTYALPGTYAVIHTVVLHNPNGVPVCTQSFTKNVIINPACNLQANFNWTTTASNPLRIEFNNTSAGALPSDSVRWTFGDGTAVNGVMSNPTIANPVHIYTQPGTYTVCLRIKRAVNSTPNACVSEVCKTVVVTSPCNLQAFFSSQADSLHPLRIKFTNLSVPTHPSDSVRWTFGDGTSISGLQSDPNVANPTHIYAQAGNYTVCIRVKKNINTTPNPCVAEFCKQVVVHPPICNLQAFFSSQPDPNHPLRIKFTNLSVPTHPSDSVRWTFGDGTSVSGLQSDPNVANPTHNYAQAGNYTVCIRVKKNLNTTPNPCVAEFCKQVIVHPPCNVQVNFSWQLDQTNPRKVYFTNLTAPVTATATALWTFGDGTSATTWNAVHEYAQPGRYRVCLKITFGPNCVKDKCDTILIPNPPPPCNNQSNFNFVRSTSNSQVYTFIPAYQNSSAQYIWTFGDGTGSQSMIATHQYAQPGTYTVCLTVWRGPNCASTTCKTIQVTYQVNCDSVFVNYNYQVDPQVPNKLYFHASSNYPILDQTWTIKRLNSPPGTPSVILHQNNPSYVFPDTGSYQVCLRAVTLGGCIKEVCRIIHITQVANTCLLQAYPNPATNIVNVAVTLTQPEMIHAYMYNSQNVLVKEKHQQGVSGLNLVTFNINDLPAGLYRIKIIYGNKVCYANFQKL
jgi:PKD repeat protein